MPLQNLGLPLGAQCHESCGEATYFDNKVLVAFGMNLRIKELFARKAVWLEQMDSLGRKDPEDGLQNLGGDSAAVEGHVAVGGEDVAVVEAADGIQAGRNLLLVAEFGWHEPLREVIAVMASVGQGTHLSPQKRNSR